MALLAIADPPYPPMIGERRDTSGGPLRVTYRSRAVRWYGEPPGTVRQSPGGARPADFHPAAADWDDLSAHRSLLESLCEEYDGWAIATTPDGLGAYHPLPVAARVMAWLRTRSIPGGHRIQSNWEAVIVLPPEGRRSRASGRRMNDTLLTPVPSIGFAGAKPPEWTHWVLNALGYEAGDTVVDLFPGSGSVSAAISTISASSEAAAAPSLTG